MSTIEEIVSASKEKNYILVFFFMPDCASCVETRPKVLQFADSNSIPIFEVSSYDSNWTEVGRYFGITDFPTLVVISRLAGQKNYLGAEKIQIFLQGAQAHFNLVNSK